MVEVTFCVQQPSASVEQMQAFPLNLQSPYVPIVDVFQEKDRQSMFTVQHIYSDCWLRGWGTQREQLYLIEKRS